MKKNAVEVSGVKILSIRRDSKDVGIKKKFCARCSSRPLLPGKDFGRLLADSRAVRPRKVLVLRTKS